MEAGLRLVTTPPDSHYLPRAKRAFRANRSPGDRPFRARTRPTTSYLLSPTS